MRNLIVKQINNIEKKVDDSVQKTILLSQHMEKLKNLDQKFDTRCDHMKQQCKDAREQVEKNINDIWQMREDIVHKIDTKEKEVRVEFGETNRNISKHMTDIEERRKKMTEELQGSINRQKEDINQAIVSVKKSVDEVKQTTEEKVTTVAEERSQHLKEISARMEWLQQ